MTRYLCPVCRTEPGTFRAPPDWRGVTPGALLVVTHPTDDDRLRITPDLVGGACRGSGLPALIPLDQHKHAHPSR